MTVVETSPECSDQDQDRFSNSKTADAHTHY